MRYRTQLNQYPPKSGDDGPDEYWKLGSREWLNKANLQVVLRDRNYYFRCDAYKDRLIDLYHRMHRGLVSYGGCSVAELKSFIQDRGIALDSGPNRRKKPLLEKLEAADDTMTFDRFGDLPPELRSRIYQMHFEEFDELPLCPAQPPITKVSRLIREEALPLFYSSCTFQTRIEVLNDSPGAKAMADRGAFLFPSDQFFVCIDQATFDFLRKAESVNVNRIQSLHVSLHHPRPHCAHTLGWNVRLNSSRHRCEVIEVDDRTSKMMTNCDLLYQRHQRALIRDVTRDLEKVFGSIDRRKGMNKLRKIDVFDVRHSMENANIEALATWSRRV